jgi:hypothetical protein
MNAEIVKQNDENIGLLTLRGSRMQGKLRGCNGTA